MPSAKRLPKGPADTVCCTKLYDDAGENNRHLELGNAQCWRGFDTRECQVSETTGWSGNCQFERCTCAGASLKN